MTQHTALNASLLAAAYQAFMAAGAAGCSSAADAASAACFVAFGTDYVADYAYNAARNSSESRWQLERLCERLYGAGDDSLGKSLQRRLGDDE